jgi:hypothetical protein
VTGIVGLSGRGSTVLRLRRDYLAITTFGIAVAIQTVANNATRLTGGPLRRAIHPETSCRPGWARVCPGPLAYSGARARLCWAWPILALEKLVDSPWGRVLRAIREDEETASSVGKHVFLFRLLGDELLALGDLEGARREYDKSMATYREIGHENGVCLTKGALGPVLLALGDSSGSISTSQQIRRHLSTVG